MWQTGGASGQTGQRFHSVSGRITVLVVTGHTDRLGVQAKILPEPQCCRRRSTAEKHAVIEETREPGVTVGAVGCRHGIQLN